MALNYRFPRGQVSEATVAGTCGHIPRVGCSFDGTFEAARLFELKPGLLDGTHIRGLLENRVVKTAIDSAIRSKSPVVCHASSDVLGYNSETLARRYVLVVGVELFHFVVHDPVARCRSRRISRFRFLSLWNPGSDTAFSVEGPSPD
jgi:hypothetical protein